MLSGNFKQILRLALTIAVCSPINTFGVVANASVWERFGRNVLYFLGSNRCPSPTWLTREQQIMIALAKPDSQNAVSAMESFLEQAPHAYEQEIFARHRHIVLHRNPQCILGLHFAGEFPNTKLGNSAHKQFEQSVERSCLVVLGTDLPWQQRLEAMLRKTREGRASTFGLGFFAEEEVPYLLIYLTKNGSSEKTKQKARKLLAEYLLEHSGIEPALRQYRVFLSGQEFAEVDENLELQVAQLFERTGAMTDARRFYERIFEKTDVMGAATTACKKIVSASLENSQEMRAWQFINGLSKRFPTFSDLELESFFADFKASREIKSQLIIAELLTCENIERSLRLCRGYDDLWTNEEAVERWQSTIDVSVPSGLAWECARLYLAWNLVKAGKVAAGRNVLDNPYGSFNEGKGGHGKIVLQNSCSSIYPAIRLRALLILGDIAERFDRSAEAMKYYQQAAQVKSPIILPEFTKPFDATKTKADKLSFEELCCLRSLLWGCQELADKNSDAAVEHLLKGDRAIAKLSQSAIAEDLRTAISRMLMLAYLQVGDYVRAEQYGLKATKVIGEHRQDRESLSARNLGVQRIENALFVLSAELRNWQCAELKSQLAHYAKNLYITATTCGGYKTGRELTESTPVQLFWDVEKQRIAQFLLADYEFAKKRALHEGCAQAYLQLEPIMFVAHLLREESFDQICSAVAENAAPEGVERTMYGFAKFARHVNRPVVAQMVLDRVAKEIHDSGDNVELLKNIADMCLAEQRYEKAVEIYEEVISQSCGETVAPDIQLKVINIYGEKLENYDKATQHCQRFLHIFTDSPLVPEVEFLMGKLAYKIRDYNRAVEQLDLFRQKHPDTPRETEAMILGATSRMFEGDTGDSIARFTEIIQKHPESDEAVRSMFLIGYAQLSEQKNPEALRTFEQLVEQFPESKYRKQAQELIGRISGVSQ